MKNLARISAAAGAISTLVEGAGLSGSARRKIARSIATIQSTVTRISRRDGEARIIRVHPHSTRVMTHLTVKAECDKRLADRRLVRDILEASGSISTPEAIAIGILRLSARIWELRHKDGLPIHTQLAPEGYAIYTLEK